MHREVAGSSELLGTYLPGWEECASGQKIPCHKGFGLNMTVLHSECQRTGVLEGFGAGEAYEAACCIFQETYLLENPSRL